MDDGVDLEPLTFTEEEYANGIGIVEEIRQTGIDVSES